MNKLYLLLLLGMSGFTHVFAQQPDQNWPIGINEFTGVQGYGNAVIRFLPDSVKIEPVSWKMNFESTVGAVSDNAGRLLLFTNGCYIADAAGDTLSNGAGLNPGTIHDWVCPENGYISPRGAMILPLPGSTQFYYVFHTGVRYEPGQSIKLGPLYYTIVDMKSNGGKGAVVSKNNILETADLEPFSAVRHGNGRDWWLLSPERNSNRYFCYLFSPKGVQLVQTLAIGPVGDCPRFGSTVFSPDGRRFARQENCRTTVFDFDRCSGALFNPVVFNRPQTTFGGGGVAFSDDGEQVLVSTHLSLLMADLNAGTPKLDTLISTDKIAGSGLQYMQRAPNGNLYFSMMHRGKIVPEFEFFNKQGTFAFTQKGLTLPVYSVKSIPSFPNFRLYDVPGSPCDTLGITAVKQIERRSEKVRTFPNPANDLWQIDLAEVESYREAKLTIYHLNGSVMKEYLLKDKITTVPVAGWSSGIYFWRMIDAAGNVYGGRFEKI